MNTFSYVSHLLSGPQDRKVAPTASTSRDPADVRSNSDFPTAGALSHDEDETGGPEGATLYLSATQGLPGERLRISLSLSEPPRIAALRRNAPPPYDDALGGPDREPSRSRIGALQVPLPDSPELIGVGEEWLETVDDAVEVKAEAQGQERLLEERRLNAKVKEREALLVVGRSWPARCSVGLYLFLRHLLALLGWSTAPPASKLLEQRFPSISIDSADTATTIFDKDELVEKLAKALPAPRPTRLGSGFFFRSSLSPSSSLPPSPMPSTPPLSAPRVPRLIPKTLVLDLDETLIHSTSRPYPVHGTRGNGLQVKVVEVVLDGRSTVYTVYKRPWVDFFLRKVSTWYTVIIFTASLPEYADPVIDWLDGGDGSGGMVGGRLFRSDCLHTNGAYVKDLSVVDADLSRVCLVDNSPASYAINQANGIPIEGWINDPDDECLLDLLPMLDSLRFTSDVRRVLGLRGFHRPQ